MRVLGIKGPVISRVANWCKNDAQSQPQPKIALNPIGPIPNSGCPMKADFQTRPSKRRPSGFCLPFEFGSFLALEEEVEPFLEVHG